MMFFNGCGDEIDGGRILAVGQLFALTLITDEKSEEKQLVLWVEDDDNWFQIQSFSPLWLADLKWVVDIASADSLL